MEWLAGALVIVAILIAAAVVMRRTRDALSGPGDRTAGFQQDVTPTGPPEWTGDVGGGGPDGP